MNTRILYIVILIIVLLLAVGTAVYLGKKKKDKIAVDEYLNPMAKFPAKRGDSGVHIEVIQRWINQRLKPPLSQLEVDGEWGPLTDTALAYVTGDNMVTYTEFQKMA